MKKNIIANIVGRFWSILSNFLFIPLYIKYLGMESYSIISFTLVIASLLAVLDSGLTATLSREFASKVNNSEARKRILNTLESSYMIIVLVVIGVIFLFSDFIVKNFINISEISVDMLSYYLKIICFGVGAQLLAKFYTGGLIGLEYQVKANIYQVMWGIFRNGIVVVIIIFSPKLETFFIWQTVSTILYVIILRYTLNKTLGIIHPFFIKPKIEKEIILKVWKFAGGMLLISLVAGLNTQLDKLTISHLLSIETLGYYTLAITLSMGLITITNPISTAILPRFTSMYSENNNEAAAVLFNKVFQMVIILIFTFTSVIVFNSKIILWIWTGNIEIVQNTFSLVPITSISMAMLSLAVMPYTIAIANAYTKLNNLLGIVSLIVTIPGYWIFTNSYGVFGAAFTFCLVQTIITLVYIHVINKKYLNKIKSSNIILKNLLYPAIVISTLCYLISLIQIGSSNRIVLLIWIGFITVILFLISIKILLNKEMAYEIYNLIKFKKY